MTSGSGSGWGDRADRGVQDGPARAELSWLRTSQGRREVTGAVMDTHGPSIAGMAATAVAGGGRVAWFALLATTAAAYLTEARRRARQQSTESTAGRGAAAIQAAVAEVLETAAEVERHLEGAAATLQEMRDRIGAVSEGSASDLPAQIDALLSSAIEQLEEARADIRAGAQHARTWGDRV
jgi:hypothetical protein